MNAEKVGRKTKSLIRYKKYSYATFFYIDGVISHGYPENMRQLFQISVKNDVTFSSYFSSLDDPERYTCNFMTFFIRL